MGILDPTEQQLRQYRSQIQRALQVLQKAQRYSLQLRGDYSGEGMVYCDSGDWIETDDVVKAIRILEGGQEGQC